MIDHIGIEVVDYERSKAFYQAALAPLGHTLLMEVAGWAGFGTEGKPEFWLRARGLTSPAVHIAFRSPDRAAVRRFYEAALQAGGRDNGSPGIRPHYHAHYYGAFVFDPDGHNVEAVCHHPE